MENENIDKNVDIMKTVFEVLGLKVPDNFDSEKLSKILNSNEVVSKIINLANFNIRQMNKILTVVNELLIKHHLGKKDFVCRFHYKTGFSCTEKVIVNKVFIDENNNILVGFVKRNGYDKEMVEPINEFRKRIVPKLT